MPLWISLALGFAPAVYGLGSALLLARSYDNAGLTRRFTRLLLGSIIAIGVALVDQWWWVVPIVVLVAPLTSYPIFRVTRRPGETSASFFVSTTLHALTSDPVGLVLVITPLLIASAGPHARLVALLALAAMLLLYFARDALARVVARARPLNREVTRALLARLCERLDCPPPRLFVTDAGPAFTRELRVTRTREATQFVIGRRFVERLSEEELAAAAALTMHPSPPRVDGPLLLAMLVALAPLSQASLHSEPIAHFDVAGWIALGLFLWRLGRRTAIGGAQLEALPKLTEVFGNPLLARTLPKFLAAIRALPDDPLTLDSIGRSRFGGAWAAIMAGPREADRGPYRAFAEQELVVRGQLPGSYIIFEPQRMHVLSGAHRPADESVSALRDSAAESRSLAYDRLTELSVDVSKSYLRASVGVERLEVALHRDDAARASVFVARVRPTAVLTTPPVLQTARALGGIAAMIGLLGNAPTLIGVGALAALVPEPSTLAACSAAALVAAVHPSNGVEGFARLAPFAWIFIAFVAGRSALTLATNFRATSRPQRLKLPLVTLAIGLLLTLSTFTFGMRGGNPVSLHFAAHRSAAFGEVLAAMAGALLLTETRVRRMAGALLTLMSAALAVVAVPAVGRRLPGSPFSRPIKTLSISPMPSGRHLELIGYENISQLRISPDASLYAFTRSGAITIGQIGGERHELDAREARLLDGRRALLLATGHDSSGERRQGTSQLRVSAIDDALQETVLWQVQVEGDVSRIAVDRKSGHWHALVEAYRPRPEVQVAYAGVIGSPEVERREYARNGADGRYVASLGGEWVLLLASELSTGPRYLAARDSQPHTTLWPASERPMQCAAPTIGGAPGVCTIYEDDRALEVYLVHPETLQVQPLGAIPMERYLRLGHADDADARGVVVTAKDAILIERDGRAWSMPCVYKPNDECSAALAERHVAVLDGRGDLWLYPRP